MPYRHDIYEYNGEHILINHNRETRLPSGLIVVNRLSTTEIGFAERPLRVPEGLVLARPMDMAGSEPAMILPSETVECDLETFATLGAERIIDRAKQLGRVAMFNPNVEQIDQNPNITPLEKERLRELHITLFRTFGSQNVRRDTADSPEIGGYL